MAKNPLCPAVNDDHQEYVGCVGCDHHVIVTLRGIPMHIFYIPDGKHPETSGVEQVDIGPDDGNWLLRGVTSLMEPRLQSRNSLSVSSRSCISGMRFPGPYI